MNELNEKDTITIKMKITSKTTTLELIESMNKKLELMKKELKFDSNKKILKVKSLDDYIFDLNELLIHYNYIIECVKYGNEADYIIIDNPKYIKNEINLISEYHKPFDNLFNLAIFNPEKKINNIVNKNIKTIQDNNNENDSLDIFIEELMNEIKLNEFNTLNDIDNINNDDEISTTILKNETTFINSSFMDDLSIFGDSVVYSNTKYEYEDINSINEKLNTSFSLVNNLNKTTLIKGISVMGRKKKRAKIINQPNAYLDERNIDLKK